MQSNTIQTPQSQTNFIPDKDIEIRKLKESLAKANAGLQKQMPGLYAPTNEKIPYGTQETPSSYQEMQIEEKDTQIKELDNLFANEPPLQKRQRLNNNQIGFTTPTNQRPQATAPPKFFQKKTEFKPVPSTFQQGKITTFNDRLQETYHASLAQARQTFGEPRQLPLSKNELAQSKVDIQCLLCPEFYQIPCMVNMENFNRLELTTLSTGGLLLKLGCVTYFSEKYSPMTCWYQFSYADQFSKWYLSKKQKDDNPRNAQVYQYLEKMVNAWDMCQVFGYQVYPVIARLDVQ